MALLTSNYALLNIALLTLILTASNAPVFRSEPVPALRAHQLFYCCSLIGQMFLYSLLTTAGNYLIFLVLGHTYTCLIINALLTLLVWFLLLGNSKVYARYRFNINRTIMKLSFGKGAREVVQPTRAEVRVIVLTVLTLFAVSLACQATELHAYRSAWYHRSLQGIVCIMALIYLGNQTMYCILSKDPTQSYRQYVCKVFGYHAFSWANILEKLHYPWRKEKAKTQAKPNWKRFEKATPITYPITNLQKESPSDPKNILVISIDACRYDMIQSNIMPFVHRFAQNACQFQNHWSHGNTTQAGIFSLFYGLTPNYWNSVTKDSIPPVLMQRTRELNYEPAIFASATLNNPAFNRNVFLNVNGLRASTPGNDPLRRDMRITDDFCHFIKGRNDKTPFLGFLFYDAAHGYYALDNLPGRFSPVGKMNHITLKRATCPHPIFNQYKNALYSIDKMIAQVINTLNQQSLLESTVIAITADHGQEFNDFEKNHWEHPSNFGQFQLQVPLVLHWPGKAPAILKHKTLHSDIAPTLLKGILGVNSKPSDYCHGQDLFDTQHRPYHIAANYTHHALIGDEYIFNLQMDGSIQTYDKRLNHIPDKQPSLKLLQDTAETMMRFHKKETV